MTARAERHRSRLIGVLALGFAALVHLLGLQLMLSGRAPPLSVVEPPPPRPPIALELPFPLATPTPHPVRDHKHRKIEQASDRTAERPPTPIKPTPPPRPAPRVFAALTPHAPPAPGPGQAVSAPSGAISGIHWGDEGGGVREALRTGPGCDFEDLKLTKAERERCNEHAARQAKKGPLIGPAADDPKRAAELAEAERRNEDNRRWKSEYGPHGMAKDALPARGIFSGQPTDNNALSDPPH
jgi:hypothetical protein